MDVVSDNKDLVPHATCNKKSNLNIHVLDLLSFEVVVPGEKILPASDLNGMASLRKRGWESAAVNNHQGV
jgi:hypothetical protein